MDEKIATESEEFLTVDEAAALLRLSRWSVYDLRARGELLAYTVGTSSTLRFRRKDVVALLRPASTGALRPERPHRKRRSA